MTAPMILASGSEIRAKLLRQAAVRFDVVRPRVDEESARASLESENATPRDVADALAEMKARKVSDRYPDRPVLGCDQVLDLRGEVLAKPRNHETAIAHLRALRGKRHTLYSAAVVCENGQPIWRHVGQVRLFMRDATDAYIEGYVARNWDSIRDAVGAYKLEEEGVRLFTRVEGDYFNVMGLPLLELLAWMTLRGDLEA